MKLIKSVIIILLLIVVVVNVSIFIFRRYFYFPDHSGTMRVRCISGEVEILRDSHGVPHILAVTEEDAFFGLGFAMAQDRPFQLEMFRRAANGELSEVLPGNEMKEMDRFSRFVQFRELGRRVYNNLEPDTKGYIDSFAAGISAGLKTLEGPVPRPFTLAAFGGEAQPWEPVDTMAFGMMVSWMKSANHRSEYFYLELAEKLGEDRAMELLPYNPPERDGRVAAPGGIPLLAAGAALGDFLGVTSGCSNWCVNGTRTTGGESILVFNAHTGAVRAPAEHYLVHMKGGGLDIAGAAIVGVPGIYSGMNRHLAWGMTQLETDCSDLHFEKLNPENSDQYFDNGEWKDMDIRLDEFCYKDKKSETGTTCETLEVRSTVRGPVISDFMDDWQRDNRALSLQWTGFMDGVSVGGYLKMSFAENWPQFRAALNDFDFNGNHILYADSEGNIGYQVAGMLPLRPQGTPPPLPANGWEHYEKWPRMLTVDEMPHRWNPDSGYMATANNQPFTRNSEHYIGIEFSPCQRRDRLYEILASKEKFTSQQMMDTQKDVLNIVARRFAPVFAADLEGAGSDTHTDFAALLSGWDYRMTLDSRAALVFEALLAFSAQETFFDELGEETGGAYINKNRFFRARFYHFLDNPDNHWFDDTGTDDIKETRTDIVRRAADRAAAALEEKFGPDREQWTWGRAHTFSVPHYAGDLTDMMNIRHGPVPGSEQTVNRFGYSLTEPFEVDHIPNLRLVADFNDDTRVHAVIHTGQSGWWGHDNYSDQTPLLARAELIEIPFGMDEIEKATVNKMTLAPLKGK